ncbi:MAG: 3-hydroxyacyl-ACP dehydratase FabZ [Victivallales bacterium]|jgi:3-hydroxymyristoyl/3-hydroxydecanoyl-(acyl carrier protein) dehydratase|nr:3-hydroxyacyl-ACP dehydratase FabZ [Victivallales bacterium]
MAKFFGVKEIRAILPQRYPMLMVDRAQQLDETRYVGIKNLTINENFFQGHFPGHAIMPGVLQLEAMKQLGELAIRPELDPRNELDVYMRIVEKVKFRRPNNPGDRVKIEVEILSIENGEAVIKAQTSNSAGVTCEAKITLTTRPKSGATAMPELYTEFDKNEATPMNVEKIMVLIPHRYPFLLIDYIAKIEGDHVFAVKNLSGNEEIFSQSGDYPVMPESLLCEITAQAGCALVLARPGNEGKLGYFMSIDRAEIFEPVYPGDQLVVDIELPPAKGRFGKGTGCIKVGDRVVFQITLMFAIVDA